MPTKIFGKNRLLKILFLAGILFFAGGCRTKCVEGADNYPACLGKKAAEKSEKTEILFWNLDDPSDAFAGQIQAFQSQNPNVKIVYKKFENEAEYENLLINEMAEGGGPDIFALPDEAVWKHRRKLAPAPENLIVPDKFRETFFAVAADALIFPDDDGFEKIYGVPLFIDTLAIYYNKAVFRDGLPSSDRPGNSWEEIKQQTFELTKRDNSIERFALSGMAMGMAENIRSATAIFSLLLLQEKANLWDEKKTRSVFAAQKGTIEGTGKPFFPAAEALKLYTSFALPTYKNYSWNQMITALYPQQKELGVFARGKTAMFFGFSTTKKDLLAIIEGLRRSGIDTIATADIGVAPVPQFSADDDPRKRDAFAHFTPLVVSRNSKNPELAWQFLLFLADTESAAEYHEKTGKPTARKDLIEEQMTEKFVGIFARQINYSKILPVLEKDDFDAIIREMIDSVARGKATVDAATKLAEKRLQCVLEKSEKKEIDRDCRQIR